MPPRRAAAAANPGPVDPPPAVPAESAPTSIDPSADPAPPSSDIVHPSQLQADDVPGPSTTYMPPQEPNSDLQEDIKIDTESAFHLPPRAPSPPLPNLTSRAFPPDPEDDTSDDEVLAQLPIFLSPALFPNLNLFQYPLRTSSLRAPTYAQDRNKQITTRIKESAGRIEVELPVDEDSNVWRRDRADELGFVADIGEDHSVIGGYGFGGRGGEKDKDKKKKDKEREGKRKDKEHWGDKMRLRSDIVPNATGYYSGIIHDGCLHLHPVSKAYQFRTSLTYLDEFDERNKRGGRRDKDDEEDKKPKANGVGGGTIAGRPVRKLIEEDNDGSGSIKDFREKMWAMAREEQEDPWIPYKWKFGVDDSSVQTSLDSLVVPLDKRERLECSTRPLDYLNRELGS